MSYFDILLIALFVVLIIRLVRERRKLNAEEKGEITPSGQNSVPYDRRKLNTASILLCVFMLVLDIISDIVRSFALPALILAVAAFVIYLIYLKKNAGTKTEKK